MYKVPISQHLNKMDNLGFDTYVDSSTIITIRIQNGSVTLRIPLPLFLYGDILLPLLPLGSHWSVPICIVSSF